MKVPLQITARNFELTEAIETAIQERARKLDRFYDRIIGCRVTVEAPQQKHHQKGNVFNVRIQLNLPGKDLVVNREPYEDLYLAIGNAFDTAHRQLQEFAGKRRGEVKAHEEVSPRAQISQLFPNMDYGLLTTQDNREVYFHRNSVQGNFDDLEIGMNVRYVESMGKDGPQASNVRIIKR